MTERIWKCKSLQIKARNTCLNHHINIKYVQMYFSLICKPKSECCNNKNLLPDSSFVPFCHTGVEACVQFALCIGAELVHERACLFKHFSSYRVLVLLTSDSILVSPVSSVHSSELLLTEICFYTILISYNS